MASSTTIDVDGFGNDKEDEMESLNFQDIPHGNLDSPDKGQTTHFTRFPHSAADSDDEADDKEKLIKEEKTGTSSFWTFAYYQQFFDVETAQVGQRIVGSMVPKPGSNYLVHQIRPNPDLYGPFWICTTLVFTTAIAGNLANYFSMAGESYHWQYDFHKVTFAATAIFSYWWLVPLLLWAVLWWRGSQAKFSFLEMLCVYGYSLAIYVPISILWAIQVSWLQWTLVVVGAVLSGSVLLLTFWPAIKEDSQKVAIGLMVFIFIMHAALAAGFVLYFFHVPASASAATTVAPAPIPVNQTMQGKTFAPVNPAAKADQLPAKAASKPAQAPLNGPLLSQGVGVGGSFIGSQNQLSRQENSAESVPQANAQPGVANVPSNNDAAPVNSGQSQGQVPNVPYNNAAAPVNSGQVAGDQIQWQAPNAQGSPFQDNGSVGGKQQQQQPLPAGDGEEPRNMPAMPGEQSGQLSRAQPVAPQKRRSLAGMRRNQAQTLGRA
ncbi:hypothetical protein EGW08_016846 [Elysia chlorotica]|uniref:Yip1 domain-containing protein n=1 Tax=Elysia chlorotica TaxID=188477 RepID=A0A433T1H3_ELYCH|nr:hypothetical protein EGW08_016846 [Elysia chlorotica]